MVTPPALTLSPPLGWVLSPMSHANCPPFSPGRTTGNFDNEIIMMNHVYRERFPKVGSPGQLDWP